jgi:hypothetical protein
VNSGFHLSPLQLRLNQMAQGIIPEVEGHAWFEGLDDGQRALALGALSLMCQQSHPTVQEGQQAILRAGLKKTFTPCVILGKAALPGKAVGNIAALPAAEQVKAFRLLIALFSIADARRRATQCSNGCGHAWHQLKQSGPAHHSS